MLFLLPPDPPRMPALAMVTVFPSAPSNVLATIVLAFLDISKPVTVTVSPTLTEILFVLRPRLTVTIVPLVSLTLITSIPVATGLPEPLLDPCDAAGLVVTLTAVTAPVTVTVVPLNALDFVAAADRLAQPADIPSITTTRSTRKILFITFSLLSYGGPGLRSYNVSGYCHLYYIPCRDFVRVRLPHLPRQERAGRVVRTSLVRDAYIIKYGLHSDAVQSGRADYSFETTSPASCPQAPLISLPKLALRVQSISRLVRTSSNALNAAGLGALKGSGRPLLSLTGL